MWQRQTKRGLKLSCDTPFTHGEKHAFSEPAGPNQGSFLNQGKNTTLCIAFWLGIFLFENINSCVKKVERACRNSALGIKHIYPKIDSITTPPVSVSLCKTVCPNCKDNRCQFHQHFTYKFFVWMSFQQLFLHTCN